MPYTDQLTAGYERQLAGNMAVSADYVHAFSRDLLMSLDLNPGLRATTAVTSPLVRQGSATLNAAVAELQLTYPGFAPFTTARHAAAERRQDRLRRAAAQRQQALQQQLQRARVLHAVVLARQHVGQRRAGERLPGARRHAPRAERRADRTSTRGTTSWSAARRCVPHTGGLNVSWVARALSGSPFSLTNAQHRSRSQRHAVASRWPAATTPAPAPTPTP